MEIKKETLNESLKTIKRNLKYYSTPQAQVEFLKRIQNILGLWIGYKKRI